MTDSPCTSNADYLTIIKHTVPVLVPALPNIGDTTAVLDGVYESVTFNALEVEAVSLEGPFLTSCSRRWPCLGRRWRLTDGIRQRTLSDRLEGMSYPQSGPHIGKANLQCRKFLNHVEVHVVAFVIFRVYLQIELFGRISCSAS